MRNGALRGCLIFSLFVVVISPAASKEMHPEPPNNQAKIQNPSGKAKRATQPPVIVNVSPPQKTHDEIEQEAKEREEKAINDRKLVEFTRRLADYTLGLFAATTALVVATMVLG